MRTLPEMCYSTNPVNEDELIIIKKGETGFYPVSIESDAYMCSADRNNELLGVDKGQRIAMENGSLHGWHIPGADPNKFSADGEYIG